MTIPTYWVEKHGVYMMTSADYEHAMTEKDAAVKRFQKVHDAIIDVLEGRPTEDEHTLVKSVQAQSRELERLRQVEQLYEAGKEQWNPVYKLVLDERDKLREQYNDLLSVAVQFAKGITEEWDDPESDAAKFLRTPAATALLKEDK